MPECDENSDLDEVPILAPVIVPITVLTGFLGSGKTTLLHHILTEAQTMRIAVVLNEFSGLTKMEKGLSLRSSEMGNDEWIEMPNGCMCCVAKDRAIQAVEQVVAKKVIDHVVIEASGTSDPGPIISMFWQEDESVSNVQLQGIVCVIDGSAFLETKEKFPVVKRQLQHADVILINKCDLASSSQRAAIIYEVKTINGFARVEETSHCNIELAHILQINSMERRFMVSEKTFEEAHHSVPSGFGNVIIKDLETRMKNLESLHKFIQSLLWVETSDFSVIRLKGLFSIAENSESNSLVRMYIVQAVGQTYECTPSLDAETSENGGVTLLVIGENITHSLILKYMSAYVM